MDKTGLCGWEQKVAGCPTEQRLKNNIVTWGVLKKWLIELGA